MGKIGRSVGGGNGRRGHILAASWVLHPPVTHPPSRARVDSPAVADLKRKLDALAAALVAAIAAILIRKFVRSLGEGGRSLT